MKNLHKQFVQLGRERNRITYKLLALLPQINEQKIYQQHGYANIYEYAARIAGLSSGVVSKALKLEEKLKDKPHLQKAVETQGINKVGIVVGLATKENEKELAEKVIHMSKPALQEYSKEARGKATTKWQVELDEEMMFMFLGLKKKFGKNLSNKECLRKILEEMNENQTKNTKPQPQAQKIQEIPGDFSKPRMKITRYIPVHNKRNLSDKCSHPNCHRPVEIIHHVNRFSTNPNHKNLTSLCKYHHEFAHNGITEPLQPADHLYRKYRQVALA
jgi:hypothetical protein